MGKKKQRNRAARKAGRRDVPAAAGLTRDLAPSLKAAFDANAPGDDEALVEVCFEIFEVADEIGELREYFASRHVRPEDRRTGVSEAQFETSRHRMIAALEKFERLERRVPTTYKGLLALVVAAQAFDPAKGLLREEFDEKITGSLLWLVVEAVLAAVSAAPAPEDGL